MLEPENERFFRKTLRHFAEMRNQGPGASTSSESFPVDWFDIPHDKLADYGAMTFLAGLTNYHREQPLARAMHYFEPPLRLGHYKIFRSNGFPRAFITWAGLSPAAERAFALDHLPLEPEHWTSGSSVWLVDFVAPFGHVDQMKSTPMGSGSFTEFFNRKRVDRWAELHRISWARQVGA